MQITGQELSIVLSVSSWIALLFFVIKASMRFGALELKVDTMWGFQMRRSMSEVVTSGVGKLNSPLVLSEETLKRLDPIKYELKAWYDRYTDRTSDASVLLGIEKDFGDKLFEMVCIPCGLSYGACLIIALVVAKGDNRINLSVGQDRH